MWHVTCALSLCLAFAALPRSSKEKDDGKPNPTVDKFVAAAIEEWRSQVAEARADIAAAKRAGKTRDMEEIEKRRLVPLLAGTFTTWPKLVPASLTKGQVGTVAGVIKAIPDEKSMVVETSGKEKTLVIVDAPAGKVAVGTRYDSPPMVVASETRRWDSKLLPVLYRLDSDLIYSRWQARRKQALEEEQAAADAAAKAKRDAPKQETDDVARAKLELAKKATKPETRLRLLKDVVENYPATPAAAEAEKLLAEEPKE